MRLGEARRREGRERVVCVVMVVMVMQIGQVTEVMRKCGEKRGIVRGK